MTIGRKRAYVLYPFGGEPYPYSERLDDQQHRYFHSLYRSRSCFQSGAALYYGLNALSNNMILCDRKQAEKSQRAYTWHTGQRQKSFAAKREITNAFLITDDDIIICDPEAEYYPLVDVWRTSDTLVANRKRHGRHAPVCEPYGYEPQLQRGRQPPCLKSDFILSLCELVIGGKEGLQPVEKTVIDRAVRNVYRDYLADPEPEKMPILGDLYDELLKQPEPEAARIAAALELYVSGSSERI